MNSKIDANFEGNYCSPYGQKEREPYGLPSLALIAFHYFLAKSIKISRTWIALLDTLVPGPNTAIAPASNKNW